MKRRITFLALVVVSSCFIYMILYQWEMNIFNFYQEEQEHAVDGPPLLMSPMANDSTTSTTTSTTTTVYIPFGVYRTGNVPYNELGESIRWIPLPTTTTTTTTTTTGTPLYSQLTKLQPVDIRPFLTATTTSSSVSNNQYWIENGREQLKAKYNTQGFLMYFPSSGLSNQLMTFESLIYTALITKRILVIPPLMNSHTDHFPFRINDCVKSLQSRTDSTDGSTGGSIVTTASRGYLYYYDDSCGEPSIQFDRYFDLIQPNNGTHVYEGPPLLFIYARDYIHLFKNEMSRVANHGIPDVVASSSSSSSTSVHRGSFYVQTRFTWNYNLSYDKGSTLRCNDNIKTELRRVLSILGITSFIGVHLRRGDYKSHCHSSVRIHPMWKDTYTPTSCYTPTDSVIEQVESLKKTFNISNVVVAHNEKDDLFLQQMKEKKWTLEDELWKHLQVKKNPEQIVFPIHIQCLMSIAEQFIGNAYSSFSMRIRVLRKLSGLSSMSFV